MRIASIDIGTNTCNLLVARYALDEGLKFIYKDKKVTALINPEFEGNKISQNAISNLLKVLESYKQVIEEFKIDKTIATATSAIRSAENKDEIVDKIAGTIGIEINVIDGYAEAEYVYEGVKNAINIGSDYVLIIDIGGGSVELVICNNKGIHSTYSFDIGVSRLIHKNKFSDPLSEYDINILNKILNETLKDLLFLSKGLKINTLIGSSGSFDTFVNLVNEGQKVQKKNSFVRYNIIDLEKFEDIYKKLIIYNYEQRYKMPGMEIARIKLIPVAAYITHFIISYLKIKELIQSEYSIKEGLIFDYISKNFKY
jgi:exopolyphosphatase/guanosine-5'-triphosphate,3'-diphosphate pyrophosphatase